MPPESPAEQRQADDDIGAVLDGQEGDVESEMASKREHEDRFEERVGFNSPCGEVRPRCLCAATYVDERSQ